MIASRRCTSPAAPSSHSPCAVGPARRERVAHALERVAVGPPAGAELGGEAAHGYAARCSRAAAPPRRRARRTARACRGRGRPASRRATARRGTAPARRPRSPRSRRRAPTRPPAGRGRAGRPPGGGTSSRRAPPAPTIAASRDRLDPHGVRRLAAGRRLAVVDRAVRDVGQVLVQRPAAGDVERLAAAADAEHREPARVGLARDRDLERVERGLDRPELAGAARRRRPAGSRSGPPDRQTPASRSTSGAIALARPAAAARPAARRPLDRARVRRCRAPSRPAAGRPRAAGGCAAAAASRTS